jgi:GAF domain-containing protein
MAEILRIIASSPTDAQPVLDAVANSAMRLSANTGAALWIRDGDQLRKMAQAGTLASAVPLGGAFPLSSRTPGNRALVERRIVHIADRSAPSIAREFPDLPPQGAEATVAVPLVREGEAIGTIMFARHRAQPYSAREIALIEAFADQAVIAIENARLFRELRDRVAELAALGEVGQALSSSLDL